jgi:hypothetical protein
MFCLTRARELTTFGQSLGAVKSTLECLVAPKQHSHSRNSKPVPAAVAWTQNNFTSPQGINPPQPESYKNRSLRFTNVQ